MIKKKATKQSVRKFFTAWQKEYPNFYTPKLKKVLQKNRNILISVSAGHGAYEKKPTYSATPFQYYEGKLGGSLGQPKVRGFKRLKGGRNFKSEVKARIHAKKLLSKYK